MLAQPMWRCCRTNILKLQPMLLFAFVSNMHVHNTYFPEFSQVPSTKGVNSKASTFLKDAVGKSSEPNLQKIVTRSGPERPKKNEIEDAMDKPCLPLGLLVGAIPLQGMNLPLSPGYCLSKLWTSPDDMPGPGTNPCLKTGLLLCCKMNCEREWLSEKLQVKDAL